MYDTRSCVRNSRAQFVGTRQTRSKCSANTQATNFAARLLITAFVAMLLVVFSATALQPSPAFAESTNTEKAATLNNNLSARFSSAGTDGALSKSTYAAALALGNEGAASSIDTASILSALETEKSSGTISAGALAKYILALDAAGVDCKSVSLSTGTCNLVDEMLSLVASQQSQSVWDAVCILPVCTKYGADQTVTDSLVSGILSAQDTTTSLFGGYGYFDSQTTAQAIEALLPYKDKADVATAIEKAVSALKAMQCSDGGFGYNAGDEKSNLDASAQVFAALTKAGVTLSEMTKDGKTPIDYLVETADEALNGYTNADGVWDEKLTSATVFYALSYADLEPAQDPDDGDDTPDGSGSDEGTGEGEGSGSGTTPSGKIAQTGDFGVDVAALALAVSALAVVAFVVLKRKVA